MMWVDRSAAPAPAVLVRGTDSLADREFEKGRAYYAQLDVSRQRGAFSFTAYRHPSVRQALERLFRGKCAYCESPIAATSPGDIDCYRPKGGVMSADGKLLPHHYWWLAAEWTNLYLVCIDCNRVSRRGATDGGYAGKGGRFPLEDESRRAPLLAAGEQLADEKPLLLDPCEPDVEQHLVFTSDGLVSSPTRRGATTIEVLGLNRLALAEARQRVAATFENLINAIGQSHSDNSSKLLLDNVKEMIAPHSAYRTMCRQLLARLTDNTPSLQSLTQRLDDHSLKALGSVAAARQNLKKFQAQQEDYSFERDDEDTARKALIGARDRRIAEIRLKNIKAVSRLTLNLTEASGAAPWLMLLGENATGKSTVLQATALALVGDNYLDQLVANGAIDPKTFVRAGAEFGEVSVRLTGATRPRRLRFMADGSLQKEGLGAQALVLGYGATRLLPKDGADQSYGQGYARIENLFDPFLPLTDAHAWLISASDERFDYAALAIKRALEIDLSRPLVRQNGVVGLRERGRLVPLERLSDGYQTTIALIADILEIVLRVWHTPDLAEGIVLLDEVGNHLHPEWKMRLVESLRHILPGMQVIATTHDPLCLRGLRDGEVALLRRGPRGAVDLVDQLPPIDGLRIDQILTSEHFGLQSTLDPSLRRLFDDYHRLLRRPRRSESQDRRVEELRSQINDKQGLGRSERERRLLAAIDQFLAERDTAATADRSAREAQLDDELRLIWRDAPVGEQ